MPVKIYGQQPAQRWSDSLSYSRAEFVGHCANGLLSMDTGSAGLKDYQAAANLGLILQVQPASLTSPAFF